MRLSKNLTDLPPRSTRMTRTTQALVDNGADKFHRHRFDIAYHQVLGMLGHEPRSILEIGVYKGWSHNAWRELFPAALIVGVDLKPRPATLAQDVVYVRGDQGDPAVLEEAASHGGALGFDLIIDDGSHTMAHQKRTYEALWHQVTLGGFYVCEDLHTSELIDREGEEGDDYRRRFNPEGHLESALDYFLRDARDRARRRGEVDEEADTSTLYPDRAHFFFSCLVAIRKLHDGTSKVWP